MDLLDEVNYHSEGFVKFVDVLFFHTVKLFFDFKKPQYFLSKRYNNGDETWVCGRKPYKH